MVERVDAVVIGAGVVGLAVGRALAARGLETLVLERERAIGTGTSSRNSEVLHAGLHGAAGWLKRRLCVAGRPRLEAYCDARGVAWRRCGKLLVARGAAQRAALAELHAQGEAQGVPGLRRLTAEEARTLEPALACEAALLSPATGIVDSHGLMLALQAELEAAGGTVATGSPVERIECGPPHRAHAAGIALAARVLVNAAGLDAPELAARTEGLRPRDRPHGHHAKGSYFALSGARSPFSHLVYPMPEPGGLGVHLTLDLAGQARFGPDVEWVEPDADGRLDYRVDPARAPAFEAAIRRWWPGLPEGALQPAYSGIRPKLAGPGEPARDFRVDGPAEHGIDGLVNLFGIDSPGLTACLALADEVLGRLGMQA